MIAAVLENRLNRILLTYVNKYWHVAICCALFHHFTAVYFNQKSYALFVFVATWWMYFQLKTPKSFHPITQFKMFLKSTTGIDKIVFCLMSAALVYTILDLEKQQYIYLLMISPLLLFYSYGDQMGLRFLPYVKIILISIVWTVVTSILPFTFEGIDWVYSTLVFFFILGITIPFDVRDFNSDPKKIKTIPQIIGVKKSIWLSVSLLIAVGITGSFFNTYLSLAAFGSAVCILPVTQLTTDRYINLVIEGCSILPLLFYYTT